MGLFADITTRNMPSKTSLYWERISKEDPARYKEMLEKAKIRNQRNRDARKQRWSQATPTVVQEKEEFTEKNR